MTNKGMTKEKKQLVLLGGLAVVLVAVLGIPGGEAEDDAAADSEAADPVASAAPAGAPNVPVIPEPAAVNPALSSSSSEEPEAEEAFKSPFESFWAQSEPVETRIDNLPPPTLTLNGTLTSGRTPVAVIDGQTRFVGDSIQGWTLELIGSREITLRSPNRNTVTIAMPLLQGEGRRLPGDGL